MTDDLKKFAEMFDFINKVVKAKEDEITQLKASVEAKDKFIAEQEETCDRFRDMLDAESKASHELFTMLQEKCDRLEHQLEEYKKSAK